MKGNFRHCHGENIQVYTAMGETHMKAIRNVLRGLKRIGKAEGVSPSITHIQVTFYEDGDLSCYSATAYVDESLVW